MRHIIIGHDYAFGRNRMGNFETLSRLGGTCGFTLEDLEPVGEGEVIYSSSLARRMISEGNVSGASQVLGRYHVISGHVVHGREIGRKIGYPTANISVCNELSPIDGVYAVMVAMGDELLQGACNIGTNPTFQGKERTVEVFLLDFSGRLYGRELSLSFVQRLRDMKKFPDAAALIEAINKDVIATRSVLEAARHELIKPLLHGCWNGDMS
jgi:riboflavin kinase/FMN adenylyltransferase